MRVLWYDLQDLNWQLDDDGRMERRPVGGEYSWANSSWQYTAAAKTNALDPTAKSLESLAAVFKKDPKLGDILNAPTHSVSDKQQIIQELQKYTTADKEGIVKNLLSTLAENNRLGALPGVVEKFGVLMGAHRGEIELVVTSAAVR